MFMGSWGVRLMGAAAVLAFVSTANAGILAASRYLVALSRDDLAPSVLKRINGRFQTPHVAVAVTGLLVAAALFVDLKTLVEGASTVLILSYALSCLCVIIIRESRLQNYRPQFRAPLYPWLQLLGLGGFLLLILAMGIEAYLISFALILVGFLTYWFYGRAAATREYALLHLVERITSRHFVTGTLESDLKAIIRDRDTIVLDHFDRLVEDCAVLDLADAMPRDVFFHRVADVMSDRVGLSPAEFLSLLIAREEESS
jgi:amino acid transporter